MEFLFGSGMEDFILNVNNKNVKRTEKIKWTASASKQQTE